MQVELNFEIIARVIKKMPSGARITLKVENKDFDKAISVVNETGAMYIKSKDGLIIYVP